MAIDVPITLLINGITLSITLVVLLIVLWYDPRKLLNQFFAMFLIFVIIWNIGALLLETAAIVSFSESLERLSNSLIQIGFVGASVSIYILVTILLGLRAKWFRYMALASILVAVGYTLFPAFNNTGRITQEDYNVTTFFYVIFSTFTFYLAWRYRRRIQNNLVIIGIILFTLGQGTHFLNTEIGVSALSTSISAIGALFISVGIIYAEIIHPLRERDTQVETIHAVSLSITSQIATENVLTTIAVQAAQWLNADAVGLFLSDKHKSLSLAASYGLPTNNAFSQLPPGQAIAQSVLESSRSVFLENYERDWHSPDISQLERETFGSIICVPLTYANNSIGSLIVISGKHNRLFRPEDKHLLELLSAQAAVAISHGQLFTEQRDLTSKLEVALNQLQTVLSSTDNPVVALNRGLRIIFANAAATKLMQCDDVTGRNLTDIVPAEYLPFKYSQIVRNAHKKGEQVYEITLGDKVYFCHLAALGEQRIEGWVAVLNNITELKELDRLKSEMIRMTSHDLKNPLQAAIANLDLLRDDLETNDNPEIHLSIDTIDKQLIKMNRIISGILDLEKVRSGRDSGEVCDPNQLVDDLLNDWMPFAKDNQVDLLLDNTKSAYQFSCDPQQFEQAVANLIENAVKFTPKGGKVWLRTYDQNKNIVFEVEDTGVGIPYDIQGQIFDRFYRGQQKGVEYVTGSGLGLSLVKTVVENHQGTIEVRSWEGKGSLFRIVIPSSL